MRLVVLLCRFGGLAGVGVTGRLCLLKLMLKPDEDEELARQLNEEVGVGVPGVRSPSSLTLRLAVDKDMVILVMIFTLNFFLVCYLIQKQRYF